MGNPIANMILGNVRSLPKKEQLQIVAEVLAGIEGHDERAEELRARANGRSKYDPQQMADEIRKSWNYRKKAKNRGES